MNQQQNVLLQLSLNDVNTCLQALFDAPARVSMGVISRIQEQAQRQLPRGAQSLGDEPAPGEAGSPPPPTPAEIVDRREKAEAAAKTPPNRATRRRAAKTK